MGLTDNQIEILGDRIAGLYQELENEVIKDIARRVKKTGSYTETAELMAKAMADKGTSPAEIRLKVLKQLKATPEYAQEVAKNTLEYKKEVKDAIRLTEQTAKAVGDEIIANVGDMSFNFDLAMWSETGNKLTKDSAFTKLVEAMSKQTNGTLKNLTKSTAFKVGNSTVKIQNAYQHALNMALFKMTSGTFSFDRAVEDCVREMARNGLRTVNYASGRSYQLDTAARMCVRTASSQLAAQITMQHCDDMETDLVEVDSHWGARPEHAVWQGKIYSRSGKNKKYPNFEECCYGEVDGLCGVNCRHTFYPYFEGISTPNEWEKEPEPQEYKGRTYTYTEATQKQRQMEREVRATKREIEATKAMGGDASILEAKKRKQINEYHDFSNAMGIRAKDNRLRVVGGSSDLKKVRSKISGAVSGALNDANDPMHKKRNAHATKYYESIRNSKPQPIVNKIAKSTGMNKEKVSNAIDHLFFKEYNLNNEYSHFDEDYYIAESIRRLREGKNIQKHDLILIEHENYEYYLMNEIGLNYKEAHKIAESKYNYSKALDEFLEKIKC